MAGYLVFVPQSQSRHFGQQPTLQHRVLDAKRTALEHLRIETTIEDVWFGFSEPITETSQVLNPRSSEFKLRYKVPAMK